MANTAESAFSPSDKLTRRPDAGWFVGPLQGNSLSVSVNPCAFGQLPPTLTTAALDKSVAVLNCVNGADVCHAINSCETRRSSKPS